MLTENIEKFSFNDLPNLSKILIIGNNCPSKYFMINEMISHLTIDQNGIVISTDDTHLYNNINSKFEKTIISELINLRYYKVNILPLDNCSVKDVNTLIYHSRTDYKISFILSTVQPLALNPSERHNFDLVILLEQPKHSLKHIYNNYAGYFPSYEQFDELFTKITSSNGCMIVNNGKKRVYWYRK